MLRLARLFAALLALECLGLAPAFAAVTPTPAMLQTAKLGLQNFVQGTDAPAAVKTIYTAGSNGSLIFSITAVNGDTVNSHAIYCYIFRSSVQYVFVTFNLPAGSGSAPGVPQVSALTPTIMPGMPLNADGNEFFYLQSGDTLQCTYTSALATGTNITLYSVGADF